MVATLVNSLAKNAARNGATCFSSNTLTCVAWPISLFLQVHTTFFSGDTAKIGIPLR